MVSFVLVDIDSYFYRPAVGDKKRLIKTPADDYSGIEMDNLAFEQVDEEPILAQDTAVDV